MPKSDLPFGSEFSPAQIDLPSLLTFAHTCGGDWKAFEAAVRERYFEGYNTNDYNRGKLANNTKLSMIAYGIIDRHAVLTDLGRALYALRHNESDLYRLFAQHILLRLHGLSLVRCVLDIQAAGETVDLIKLRKWLDERGIHFPRGGKHPSTMRIWLQKAGVFSSEWHVDETKLTEIAGLTPEQVDALSGLTRQQTAFLKTLANIGGEAPLPANEVEKLATATYGISFNEKTLPKDVLYPLRDAGYITLERATTGRGAKSATVLPSHKLEADFIIPLLEQIEALVHADLLPYVRLRLDAIIERLSSADKHIKGLALEALALKLMRMLDMTYVATRLRGTQTGGAEVDLIFEADRLVFSRWQVQCKNTTRVCLDDVAKEVGLTHMLKSNVIVIVSTGDIGAEARRYADSVMRDSNLCIVMIDHADVHRICETASSIVDVFAREARKTMKIKTLEINPTQ